MLADLSEIFARYEAIRHEADALFQHIAAKFPQCVTCKPGCCDCCYAVFDLSLVEAMYINNLFNTTFAHGRERSQLLDKASESDRAITRIKKQMYLAEKNGENPNDIMARASATRLPCPLLNDKNECILYEGRPITCRLYGVPQAIGGQTRVCGYSAFDPGKSYPTVQVGKIQKRLEELSGKIGKVVGSRFELTDVYVPLSMALLTKYDDAYLGIGNAGKEDE